MRVYGLVHRVLWMGVLKGFSLGCIAFLVSTMVVAPNITFIRERSIGLVFL
jgi:hypothetical protein